MITSFLITDGGPHSSEKWAEATASHIIQIGEHIAGDELARARRFELTLIDILEGHHCTVQDGERGAIDEHGHDRLLHHCDCSHHVDVEGVLNEIVEAAASTSFATHFARPEVRVYLRDMLGTHFNSSIHVERCWHADRNPVAPQSQQYMAIHHACEHDMIEAK